MKKSLEILVSGKVQGVYFRKSAQEKALALDISGTVQNLDDGSVFLKVFSENESAIEEFLVWCQQGPAQARVDQIACKEISWQQFEGFQIIR